MLGLVLPPRDRVLLVFGQGSPADLNIDAWNAQAVRFFATRIGFAKDRSQAPATEPPATEALEFVIAPDGEAPGIRSVFTRSRDDEDLAIAQAADARAGGTGLALLAARCPSVWLVARAADEDLPALRLAAVIASLVLGPILDARAGELFGVKTARTKIEAARTRLALS